VQSVLISAFGADNPTVRGEVAEVCWLGEVTAAELAGIGAARAAVTANTSVFVGAYPTGYRAESFSPGGEPIRFCGHGALAAALYVFEHAAPAAQELGFSSAAQTWHAYRVDGDTIRLAYARPKLRPLPVPDFAAGCIGETPIAAAESGDADDYLLLELPDVAAVRSARPRPAAIERHTRRALIVTAADSDAPGVVFRYFAPQYGEPESGASGSGGVQLGAYWAARFGTERFRARQLSPAGALMWLRCHEDKVELTGRVGYG
jgi:predicted PhzF superfamily epimerase YddE/YHI9